MIAAKLSISKPSFAYQQKTFPLVGNISLTWACFAISKSQTHVESALLTAVLPQRASQEIEESTAALRKWSRYTSKSSGESVILTIVSGDSDAKITRDKICSSLFWGYIATATTPYDFPCQDVSNFDLRGRLVHRNTVDYKHIRRWLERCDQNRFDCRAREEFRPFNARLLTVKPAKSS
jgi:hypothetical protein